MLPRQRVHNIGGRNNLDMTFGATDPLSLEISSAKTTRKDYFTEVLQPEIHIRLDGDGGRVSIESQAQHSRINWIISNWICILIPFRNTTKVNN